MRGMQGASVKMASERERQLELVEKRKKEKKHKREQREEVAVGLLREASALEDL